MFDDTDRDHTDVARTGTEQLVLDVVRARHGQEGIEHRPIHGLSVTISRAMPADLAAGIAAARLVAGHAQRIVGDYAREARGRGVPWRELAEPLGVDMRDEDDPAAAAFERVAPEPSMRFDHRYVYWHCDACGERVVDRGPYAAHPVDVEEGHADTCTRHRAEIAEYESRLD